MISEFRLFTVEICRLQSSSNGQISEESTALFRFLRGESLSKIAQTKRRLAILQSKIREMMLKATPTTFDGASDIHENDRRVPKLQSRKHKIYTGIPVTYEIAQYDTLFATNNPFFPPRVIV